MPVSIAASITENSISVDNNSSSVTVKVKAAWTSGSFDHNPPKLTVTIDGVKYTKSVSLNPNNTTSGSSTIYSKTLNIAHNSDGSKTLTVSASYATSTSSGTVKDSVSKTLTTIARKSAPSCPSSAMLGDTITIATNRKSSSFTHTLTASWNGKETTIATKTTQSSVSWTIPFSWCTAGSSGKCTITCTTYNGNTSLGSNTCSLTLFRPGTSTLYLPDSSCMIDGSSSAEIYTQGNYPGYTHHLSYTVNDVTGTDGISDPSVVGSTTFTPPLSLLDHITEAESASCTIRLDTCFEDIVIATDRAAITLIIPASVIPKAEITAVSDTVTCSKDSTEMLLQHYGAFVSGKTIPEITVTGTASYSSPIKTYTGSFTSESSMISSESVITSDQAIKESDTSFTASVTDARGRTSETAERSVSVLSYTEPRISTFSGSPVIWVCKTHLQGKTKCPMQSIKDEDLKRLFLTMMNKLIYSYRLILRPYANSLKDNAKKETLDQIDALKGQLSENSRKRQTLTHLMTQGIIDQTLYSRETAELLAASEGIRKEIDFLENTTSNVTEVLLKTRALLHFAEKSEMLQEFDGELFNEFVDHITVHSRHEITFCLKCGLELKERM